MPSCPPGWCAQPSAAPEGGNQWSISILLWRVAMDVGYHLTQGCLGSLVSTPWGWSTDEAWYRALQPSPRADAVPFVLPSSLGLGWGEASFETTSSPLFFSCLILLPLFILDKPQEPSFQMLLPGNMTIENWTKKVDPEKCSVNMKMLNFTIITQKLSNLYMYLFCVYIYILLIRLKR